MIADIPTGELEVPQYAIWMLSGWVLSVLISGWSGYRWGLRSQIASKTLEVKTNMLPIIEKFIVLASGESDKWFGIRPDSIEELMPPSIQLQSLVRGEKRRRLIGAWNEFSSMTPAEFHVPQPNESESQANQMQTTLLDRLNALKSSVMDC